MTEAKQASDLWVKIARWYDSALDHTEYAIASAKKALSLDSNHVGAMSALADFYRKLGQWKDLVADSVQTRRTRTGYRAQGRGPAVPG
jgi:Tfp pilus assembly protein PilF